MNLNANVCFHLVGRRLSSIVFAFVLLALTLCPTAHSAVPAQKTLLRGCLRTIGQHAFILIGEDRLGYMLNGDRGVFSRHTDQEVEIAGTASEPTRNDAPSATLLLNQTTKPDKKNKAKPVLSIPGLRNVQVSSLTPLSQQCAAAAAAR